MSPDTLCPSCPAATLGMALVPRMRTSCTPMPAVTSGWIIRSLLNDRTASSVPTNRSSRAVPSSSETWAPGPRPLAARRTANTCGRPTRTRDARKEEARGVSEIADQRRRPAKAEEGLPGNAGRRQLGVLDHRPHGTWRRRFLLFEIGRRRVGTAGRLPGSRATRSGSRSPARRREPSRHSSRFARKTSAPLPSRLAGLATRSVPRAFHPSRKDEPPDVARRRLGTDRGAIAA